MIHKLILNTISWSCQEHGSGLGQDSRAIKWTQE